jgi:hypothetical protein
MRKIIKYIRNLTLVALVLFPFVAISQYVGKSIPSNKVMPCSVERINCILAIPDITGTYTLNKDGSSLTVKGAFIWSNSADPELLAMVSHLELRLLLLKGNTVVHEEVIKVPSKANKPVTFEHSFAFGGNFELSAFIEYEFFGPG